MLTFTALNEVLRSRSLRRSYGIHLPTHVIDALLADTAWCRAFHHRWTLEGQPHLTLDNAAALLAITASVEQTQPK